MNKKQLKNKLEGLLISSGCKEWGVLRGYLIAPNGHRFFVDIEGSIFAIFHRESEWGKKDNFFELWKSPDLEKNALNFLKNRLI